MRRPAGGRTTDLTGLDLATGARGTRLRLRVIPGAGRSAVVGIRAGALKLRVTAPPERGRANRAVRELVAALLDVPAARVEMVSGETSRDKIVLVPLSPGALRSRLEGATTGDR